MNLEKAIRRAEAGNVREMKNLGLRFFRKRRNEKNAKEAAKWLRMAAEQGDRVSQNALGELLIEGRGVEKDEAEAVRFFKLAAEKDYPRAQFNLANCYDEGIGVERSDVEATRMYRKAAENEYADAQFMLAVQLASGTGTDKDLEEAEYWYRKALKHCIYIPVPPTLIIPLPGPIHGVPHVIHEGKSRRAYYDALCYRGPRLTEISKEEAREWRACCRAWARGETKFPENFDVTSYALRHVYIMSI